MSRAVVNCPGSGRPDALRKTVPCMPIEDRKSTRLNSSHMSISYAVFCLKKKKKKKKKKYTEKKKKIKKQIKSHSTVYISINDIEQKAVIRVSDAKVKYRADSSRLAGLVV